METFLIEQNSSIRNAETETFPPSYILYTFRSSSTNNELFPENWSTRISLLNKPWEDISHTAELRSNASCLDRVKYTVRWFSMCTYTYVLGCKMYTKIWRNLCACGIRRWRRMNVFSSFFWRELVVIFSAGYIFGAGLLKIFQSWIPHKLDDRI